MTSIEWLEEKLIDNGVNFLSEEFEFIKQAKEMHKAEQESLYTEEQVREAIDMSRKGIITEAYGDLEVEYLFEKEQIIQSLKNKKD
jgi:hypothetical protein